MVALKEGSLSLLDFFVLPIDLRLRGGQLLSSAERKGTLLLSGTRQTSMNNNNNTTEERRRRW